VKPSLLAHEIAHAAAIGSYAARHGQPDARFAIVETADGATVLHHNEASDTAVTISAGSAAAAGWYYETGEMLPPELAEAAVMGMLNDDKLPMPFRTGSASCHVSPADRLALSWVQDEALLLSMARQGARLAITLLAQREFTEALAERVAGNTALLLNVQTLASIAGGKPITPMLGDAKLWLLAGRVASPQHPDAVALRDASTLEQPAL
jgi:hypothetical protein